MMPGNPTDGAPGATEADLPEYTVRKSNRAQRTRLRVDLDGKVTVVVPNRARATGYDDFVRQHAAWVRKQQARFAALRQESNGNTPGLANSVQYRGRAIPLKTVRTDGVRIALQYDGESFLVRRPDHATDEDLSNLLRSWFRQVARALFTERVFALNAQTRYKWARIRIGEQKTKWGSCSTRGTLSFNWRLLMAPPEVLDYVVIHELAHLKEPNHSPAFWSLVEEQCPNHKSYRRWLNKHGVTLGF